MNTLIAILLFSIFAILSLIHVYWAFGGSWAMEAVVPTRAQDQQLTFRPPFIATISVAIGLFMMGWISLAQADLWPLPFDWNWAHWGLIGIASIFALRAIGEFKYVGLFKRVKGTSFAKNDHRIYTPLCLLISSLSILLLWIS
ncbi:MAG: DUF3995 domain-containing protein [Bacteroidota bacterium]